MEGLKENKNSANNDMAAKEDLEMEKAETISADAPNQPENIASPTINGDVDSSAESKDEDDEEKVNDADKEKIATDNDKEKKAEEEKENKIIDVFGTGEIIKEKLESGRGSLTRPNFGEVCTCNITTKLLDGTVLDEKTNYKCILGHLEVVQALDLTLMLTEIGETAKVTSVTKFTAPKLDFNPEIPVGTEKLVYEFELLDVDPIPNYYNMNSDDLAKVLSRKKELGNFSMIQDDHTTALSTYNYAKEIIDQATSTIDTSLKVAIWNNMAACYLKMQNYSAVVDHTTKVLSLQPTNVKAMFRKGKALGLKGNYKQALEVLNRGIKIAPEKDLKLFHQAAAEFKQKMNKASEKERAMYKAMFSPDSKSAASKKTKSSSGMSWWTVGAAAAVVIAIGAALIKVNLSNS